MAKKKKQPVTQLSPENFMRTKARTLPIGKCYINANWKEVGKAAIYVSRIRPSGNVAMAGFMVDLYCLGVKDVFFNHNMLAEDFDDIPNRYASLMLEEVDYNVAHNLIYGAIDFAQEAGINPHKDFRIAQYVLEEDSEDVPLMDFEFGYEGKYFLRISADGAEQHYVKQLQKRLGSDFIFTREISFNDDDDDAADDDDALDDYDLFDDDCYSYNHPEYRADLPIIHKFIAQTLADEQYNEGIPEDVARSIFELPEKEVAADLSAIISAKLAETCTLTEEQLKELPTDFTLLNALLLMAAHPYPDALPMLLELACQRMYWTDYQFEECFIDLLPLAICRAVEPDSLSQIDDKLNAEGIEEFLRAHIITGLCLTALYKPELRADIMEIFARKLSELNDQTPEYQLTFFYIFIYDLIQIGATELLPQLEEIENKGYMRNIPMFNLEHITEEVKANAANPRMTCLAPDADYSELLDVVRFDVDND